MSQQLARSIADRLRFLVNDRGHRLSLEDASEVMKQLPDVIKILDLVAYPEAGAIPTPMQRRYRHKVRGTTYRLVGSSKFQIASETLTKFGISGSSAVTLLSKMDNVSCVTYASELDSQQWWTRVAIEFNDGRFEEIT